MKSRPIKELKSEQILSFTFRTSLRLDDFARIIYNQMKKLYTIAGNFLIGFLDSVSMSWIRGVLFYTDPVTGKILPQSLKLQQVLLKSIIQAGVITTLLPWGLKWLGLSFLSTIVMALSLVFTYGYLAFYNMDVTRQAREVIVWKTKKSKEAMPELDIREKIDPITDISNQIQSFIFLLLFYTPANLLLIIINLFEGRYLPWAIALLDSFFNTAFYYFRKWPYDKYNVAFLEANMSYAMGYGAFVSIVTDVLLPSPFSIGGYLLLSQMMIINAMCHTPPTIEFNSFGDIFKALKDRKKLGSAYNVHRLKLRESKEYRSQLMKGCVFMKPFFSLTTKLNELIQKNLFHNNFKVEDQPKSEASSINQVNKDTNLQEIKEMEEEETSKIDIGKTS